MSTAIGRACRITLHAAWQGVLLGVLLPLPCHAGAPGGDEVYKTTDAQGNVTYSDRVDSSVSANSVVRIEPADIPPRVIHFCWTNCFTLTLEDGVYKRDDGTDETWTVEHFSSRSVLLRRHDAPAAWNGFKPEVEYGGEVDGDRLLHVTVDGQFVPNVVAAWGTALDSLPGSNAERDQRRTSSITGPLTSSGATLAPEAPPPLPDPVQPPGSEDGYLWTPGYWSWSDGGYYWVPGLWVRPPRVGLLWTPGYWGFVGRGYVFHPGYWSAHVGYYGGINYGFGYAGVGFTGGRWVGESFAYNRAVTNVDPGALHNIYGERVAAPVAINRASYNGGPGGVVTTPTAAERAAAAEPHFAATPLQVRHIQQAGRHPSPGTPAYVARSTGSPSRNPPVSQNSAMATPRSPGVHVAPRQTNSQVASTTAEQAPAAGGATTTPKVVPGRHAPAAHDLR